MFSPSQFSHENKIRLFVLHEKKISTFSSNFQKDFFYFLHLSGQDSSSIKFDDRNVSPQNIKCSFTNVILEVTTYEKVSL